MVLAIDTLRRGAHAAAQQALFRQQQVHPTLRPMPDPSPAATTDVAFRSGQDGLRAFGLDARAGLFGFFGRADRGDPPVGTADPNHSGVAVNGTAYHVGPYEEPDIRHDNGFLQNRDDPNDPVPIPTREPTQAERDYYEDQLFQARGGNIARHIPFVDKIDPRLGLDNALPAYEHFLTGNGEDRTFDYGAYLRDDETGQSTRDSALSGIRNASDQLYGDLETQVGPNAGDSVTFEVQGDPTQSGYPASEDWQKAIGGHTQWSQATVTVTRQEDGSLQATANVTLHAEDRYNFNPGQSDIATGAPDSERGVLEETGLAHQYTQTGQAEFTTSWTIGNPGAPSETEEGHSRG